MLGLEFVEGAHQRHRQVEAEVIDRKECQVLSRTDGSMGDKPRSGLKRWGRQKPRFGLRQQVESFLVDFIILKGVCLIHVAANPTFLQCLCLLVCCSRQYFLHP